MLLVVNNALQGILSSFFFKYADTILKKYSSTMATIFTGLVSAALFGHALTINFCIGVTIVFISMHIFFSQGMQYHNMCTSTWNVMHVCCLRLLWLPGVFCGSLSQRMLCSAEQKPFCFSTAASHPPPSCVVIPTKQSLCCASTSCIVWTMCSDLPHLYPSQLLL